MAPRRAENYCCLLMALALILNVNMIMVCRAEQHVVGDDRGWDPISNIQQWASRKTFRVGDNLWFAYAAAQQSVLELKSQEEFEKCDTSNPIKLYDGGLDAVPLIEEGSRYFISARPQDCQRGMKVHVDVVSDGLDKDNSDNFDVVSDGLDNVAKDFNSDLISVGLESGADNVALKSVGLESGADNVALKSDGLESGADNNDLISDGMENYVAAIHHFSSSTRSSVIAKLSSAADWVKKARMEAVAEAPTSGTYELSYSRSSFSMSYLTLSFWFLVTTMLYAMA